MSEHTKEPWSVEEIDNDGEYGSGGPDTSNGFKSFAICDEQGHVLFDSLNRDTAVSAIHEDEDEDGYAVAAWDEVAKRDARRIIACVNACAGIDTELLTAGVVLQNAQRVALERWDYKAQRDELLTALKSILEHDGATGSECFDVLTLAKARSAGFAAISSAEGPDLGDQNDKIDAVTKALRRAWQLGQTYWQQADSDYESQNKKCDATQQKFDALVDEVRAMLAAREAAK